MKQILEALSNAVDEELIIDGEVMAEPPAWPVDVDIDGAMVAVKDQKHAAELLRVYSAEINIKIKRNAAIVVLKKQFKYDVLAEKVLGVTMKTYTLTDADAEALAAYTKGIKAIIAESSKALKAI